MSYYCHRCKRDFTSITADFVCPNCDLGFVELIEESNIGLLMVEADRKCRDSRHSSAAKDEPFANVTISESHMIESTQCHVCMEEYLVGETVLKLNDCDHLYHNQCIIPWLSRHNTCPVCRQSVRNNPYNERRTSISEESDDELDNYNEYDSDDDQYYDSDDEHLSEHLAHQLYELSPEFHNLSNIEDYDFDDDYDGSDDSDDSDNDDHNDSSNSSVIHNRQSEDAIDSEWIHNILDEHETQHHSDADPDPHPDGDREGDRDGEPEAEGQVECETWFDAVHERSLDSDHHDSADYYESSFDDSVD